MTTVASTQRDKIDAAVRKLDPLSKVRGAVRSKDEYDDLRDTIIARVESDENESDLIRTVREKIGLMGVPEESVDVESLIAEVVTIAGRLDAK